MAARASFSGGAMARKSILLGSGWPAPRSDYDFLKDLPPWDRAWEIVRRDPDYHNAYHRRSAALPAPERIGDNVVVYRMQRADPGASAWALSAFHRSPSIGD